MGRALLALTMAAFAAAPGGAAQEPGEGLLAPERTLRGHTRLVRCLAYSSEGVLASGGQDRLLCLWSGEGERLHRIDLRPSGA